MKRFMVLAAAGLIAACEPIPDASAPAQRIPTEAARQLGSTDGLSRSAARANYVAVVRRMEPVAEAECRRLSPNLNCDFKVIVDGNAKLPPNAYQTRDRTGRPIIGFTQALLTDVSNADELAFIFGHEAAHHIRNHLTKRAGGAIGGSLIGAIADAALGTGGLFEDAGGFVGGRVRSKEHELEADGLGAIIAERGGYDGLKGAQYFNRIPDPGDVFLGTHPPNQERFAAVRRALGR
ncbi:MAG: M48 family metalloprotease [Litoreibacter sp.]|nr:M48 family metalloprotease [Litoreibacter sp.]MCY4335235.1 M48 family metalloprotease [Litoreibacter sp.]